MRKTYKRHPKTHPERYDSCCPELMLKRHFKRYHRFFIFSPFFLLTVLFMAFVLSRGKNSIDSSSLLIGFLTIVVLKEFVAFGVSRRIYSRILVPVENLKMAVFEVTQGNYDVQVQNPSVPEIRELIEAFNEMSARLRESELLKQKYEINRKELIASISHDLKTPITSINGFTDGILEGVANTPEKQESYVRIIQQNARYMNRLIDDLLLYSKLDLHKLNFDYSFLPFGKYVSELFSELKLENEEYGVSMTFINLLESDVSIPLDSRHFTRSIRNIVANAVTHGHGDAPQINFELTGTKDALILCIQDNGPGITPEQLPHIFDRFYKADCSRNPANGSSGLGLAIAREIVQAHQGVITAESSPGYGARICIRLPILREVSHE